MFVEGVGVWGGMFDQAAAVHRSSSSAVDQLCAAVPTGCSGGLPPCVWRGAEGRLTPERGSRTGAAGTVLLPQERAVQTAWWSTAGEAGRHTTTHEDSNTQTCNRRRHEATQQDREDGREDKKTDSRGRRTDTREFSPRGRKSEAEKDCGKESRGNPVKKKENTWKKWRNG